MVFKRLLKTGDLLFPEITLESSKGEALRKVGARPSALGQSQELWECDWAGPWRLNGRSKRDRLKFLASLHATEKQGWLNLVSGEECDTSGDEERVVEKVGRNLPAEEKWALTLRENWKLLLRKRLKLWPTIRSGGKLREAPEVVLYEDGLKAAEEVVTNFEAGDDEGWAWGWVTIWKARRGLPWQSSG